MGEDHACDICTESFDPIAHGLATFAEGFEGDLDLIERGLESRPNVVTSNDVEELYKRNKLEFAIKKLKLTHSNEVGSELEDVLDKTIAGFQSVEEAARFELLEILATRPLEAWQAHPIYGLSEFYNDCRRSLLSVEDWHGVSQSSLGTAKSCLISKYQRLIELLRNGERELRETSRLLRPVLKSTNDQPADEASGGKLQKSTVRGEADLKLRAALTQHHQYENGSCQNFDPAVSNELARSANVAGPSAHNFFKKWFSGHSQYKVLCQKGNESRLNQKMRELNGEDSSERTYDRVPTHEHEHRLDD